MLQFFLIVFGSRRWCCWACRTSADGAGSSAKLDAVATAQGLPAGAYTQRGHMGTADDNPMGVEWFGLVMGLGFVLSFGYWCTDFLVVQRAMAADSMTAARRTPLIAAFPKMLFPFLVILPGMIALALAAQVGGLISAKLARCSRCSMARAPMLDYDLAHADDAGAAIFPRACSASASPRSRLVHVGHGGERHRVQHRVDLRHLPEPHPPRRLGSRTTSGWDAWRRWAASCCRSRRPTSPRAFNNIMDLLQLVFAFVNAPLFATFALGMFWRRATGHGAFFGLAGGHRVCRACFTACRCPTARPRLEGRLDRTGVCFSQRDGSEFLRGHRCLDRLFCADDSDFPGYPRNKTDAELRGLVYSLTPTAGGSG